MRQALTEITAYAAAYFATMGILRVLWGNV